MLKLYLTIGHLLYVFWFFHWCVLWEMPIRIAWNKIWNLPITLAWRSYVLLVELSQDCCVGKRRNGIFGRCVKFFLAVGVFTIAIRWYSRESPPSRRSRRREWKWHAIVKTGSIWGRRLACSLLIVFICYGHKIRTLNCLVGTNIVLLCRKPAGLRWWRKLVLVL